ncbi:hypothetical protein [Streptomyces mirabilis]|uniref:hypothetical protein n=1 Tax=Streptomyces mirabilis TaxID=68239 RepID=UPI003F4B81FD
MKARPARARMPKTKTLLRTAVAATAAAALSWLALAGGSPLTGGTDGMAQATSVADEAPGYAVEDFNYPNADKVLTEKNIKLKRGDGHITLADCATGTGQLEVYARSRTDKICFQVTGNSGWLTLEIPAVYGMKGNDYSTQVDMTTGTEEKSFDIAKNSWTGVGESADPDGRDFMLMEIRATK